MLDKIVRESVSLLDACTHLTRGNYDQASVLSAIVERAGRSRAKVDGADGYWLAEHHILLGDASSPSSHNLEETVSALRQLGYVEAITASTFDGDVNFIRPTQLVHDFRAAIQVRDSETWLAREIFGSAVDADYDRELPPPCRSRSGTLLDFEFAYTIWREAMMINFDAAIAEGHTLNVLNPTQRGTLSMFVTKARNADLAPWVSEREGRLVGIYVIGYIVEHWSEFMERVENSETPYPDPAVLDRFGQVAIDLWAASFLH